MRRLVGGLALGLALLALLAWLVMRSSDPSATRPSGGAAPVETIATDDATRQHVARARDEPSPESPPTASESAWTGPVATGRVVDGDGVPVAGARIVSYPDDVEDALSAATVGADGSRSFVGTTEGNGTFELPVDPDGVSVVLTATSDAGFGQTAVTPHDRTARIVLVPWLTLTGHVRDKEERPIAGATVTAHLLLDALVEERRAVTDENGAYEIGRLPPLGWGRELPYVGTGLHGWLIAEAEGFAPVLVGCDGKATNADAGRVNVDLTLVGGITLRGKVVDGDTNQAIAGATVVCWSVEGMQSFSSVAGVGRGNPVGPRPLGETTSAEDGTYRFDHLPAQGPSGVASHNIGRRGMTLGHVAAWKDGYVFGGDEIPVSADGATLDTDITLWPAAAVEGRVVDSAGLPIAGAGVYPSVPDRRPALNGFPDLWDGKPTVWPRTDAEGRYRVTTFRASRHGPTNGTLTAGIRVGRSWISGEAVEITATAGDTVVAPDLVVPLDGVPRATLIVTDADGRPLPGATVGAMTDAGRTDMHGRYEWAAQPRRGSGDEPSLRALTVRAAGHAPQRVEFTPGRGAAVEVTVRMEPGRRITGRVATADGRPVEGARVHVVDGKRAVDDVFHEGRMFMAFALGGRESELIHYATSTVEADGSFVVEDLPDGPYHVAAEMSSRAPTGPGRPPKVLRDTRSEVMPDTSDLLLTIPIDDAPATQALEVVVTDASGEPIGKSTGIAEFGGPRLYAQQASPGRMRFAALPAGAGTITVSAPGYRAQVVENVVIDAHSAPEPITVALVRGTVLRGTVRPASGELPDGSFLVARPVRGDGYTGALSGSIAADGTYAIVGLAPGKMRLHVVQSGVPRHAASFVPEEAGVVDIPDQPEVARDLVVIPAGTISILVRDERFAPSPFMGGDATDEQRRVSRSARIEVLDDAGALLFTFTPVHRNMSVNANVAPGEYVVRLHEGEGAPTEERPNVTAGDTARVRFPGK